MSFSNILSTIAAPVQSILNNVQQKSNVRNELKANMTLADYQYSKDLQMWGLANQYNSPAQQMKRLEAAGLNPNMVYGSGSASAAGSTATALPKFSAPSANYSRVQTAVDLPSTLSTFQDFQIKQAQIDNLKMQNELKALELQAAKPFITSKSELDENGNPVISVVQNRSLPSLKRQLVQHNVDIRAAEANKREQMLLADLNSKMLKNAGTTLSNMMQQKELNWYTARRLTDIISKGVAALSLRSLFSPMQTLRKYNAPVTR